MNTKPTPREHQQKSPFALYEKQFLPGVLISSPPILDLDATKCRILSEALFPLWSLVNTAKHEIAHLFGVFDPTVKTPEACPGADFMYTWCDTDAWSESLAASSRSNRQRTWTKPTPEIQYDLDKQFEYVRHDFEK